jgi:hypothetical protein
MRAICSRLIPYLAGASIAVELDKLWDLQTLERPLAFAIVFLVWAMLMTIRRERRA